MLDDGTTCEIIVDSFEQRTSIAWHVLAGFKPQRSLLSLLKSALLLLNYINNVFKLKVAAVGLVLFVNVLFAAATARDCAGRLGVWA